MPQIGSTATAAARRGARTGAGVLAATLGAGLPRRDGDDLREDRQRDLGRGRGRRCRSRPERRSAASCSSGTPSARSSVDHAGAALVARHEADVRHAGLERRGAACAARRVRARRRRARGRRPRARGCLRRRRRGRARARRRAPDSAAAIGVSPTTRTRGAGSTGSRKISIAPPDRHGLCAVDGAVLDRDLLPRAGVFADRPVGNDSQEQRLLGLDRLQWNTPARSAARTHRRRTPRSCRRPARARRLPPSRSSAAARARPSRSRTPCLLRRAPGPAATRRGSSLRRFWAPLHRRPDTGRGARHVDVVDAVGLVERVDDRVHDRGRRPDVRRLADALRSERDGADTA